MDQSQLQELPDDLPVPGDDGAAKHLVGMRMPKLTLLSTNGGSIALDQLGSGRTVLYLYPLTGRPGVELPPGWDLIPGARGCTPEACGFRDHLSELRSAGAERIYGLSSQSSEYQHELVERLHLPFELLSDERLALSAAVNIPTFTVESVRLYKRLTLVIDHGVIEHAFYPIFPPDAHAREVVGWLKAHGE